MSLQRPYNLYESAVKQLTLKFEIFNSEFNVFYDHNPIHPQLQRLPVAVLGHPGAGLPLWPHGIRGSGNSDSDHRHGCLGESGTWYLLWKYASAIKNAEIDRQMQDRYKRIKASEGGKKWQKQRWEFPAPFCWICFPAWNSADNLPYAKRLCSYSGLIAFETVHSLGEASFFIAVFCKASRFLLCLFRSRPLPQQAPKRSFVKMVRQLNYVRLRKAVHGKSPSYLGKRKNHEKNVWLLNIVAWRVTLSTLYFEL